MNNRKTISRWFRLIEIGAVLVIMVFMGALLLALCLWCVDETEAHRVYSIQGGPPRTTLDSEQEVTF